MEQSQSAVRTQTARIKFCSV